MRLSSRIIIGVLGVLTGLSAAGQDLSRPPGATVKSEIVTNGWAASRDVLGQALTKAYQPGGLSALAPGSTSQPGYESWLLLWQWCELLSRDEQSEAAKFVALHFRYSPGAKMNYFLPPGESPPAEFIAAPDSSIAKIMADPGSRASILGRLVPADSTSPQARPLADLLEPAVAAEWLGDEAFLRQFFATLTPQDYAPAVLRILQAIRLAQPKKFAEYRALAIAIAVVYDEKLPSFWPHRQVDPRDVPIKNYDPVEWFDFWVRNNESSGSLADLRVLGPEQIKFVVDAPLDESEFQWARDNVRIARNEFTKAFSSVTYNFDRITRNQIDWENGPYTLAAIKKLEGICVDQAYFAMIAGKAHDLPTMFFTGQGSEGGHAWFGYLKADNQWELDCGRYENQKYVTGEALDPQTWTPISDHELVFQSKHFHDTPAYAASRDDIIIAGIFGSQHNPTRQAAALDSAIQVCPQNPAAWDAKAEFLQETRAPIAALRDLHTGAAKEFSGLPDLKTFHENALLALARQEGDQGRVKFLENQIVDDNETARADLSVKINSQQLQDLLASGNFSQAMTEYQNLMTSQGKTGGGVFFEGVVRPFVTTLLNNHDYKRAKDATMMARRNLAPANGTPMDMELSQLEAVAGKN